MDYRFGKMKKQRRPAGQFVKTVQGVYNVLQYGIYANRAAERGAGDTVTAGNCRYSGASMAAAGKRRKPACRGSIHEMAR